MYKVTCDQASAGYVQGNHVYLLFSPLRGNFIFDVYFTLSNMNIISYGLYLIQLMETTRTGQCFQSVQSPAVLGRGSEHGHVTILHRGLVDLIAPGLATIRKHSDVTWTHAQVWYLRDRALKRKTLISFPHVAFHLALAAVLFTVSTLASELSLKIALAFAKKGFSCCLI